MIALAALLSPSENASQKKKEERRKYIYGIWVSAYGRALIIVEKTNQKSVICITGIRNVHTIPNPEPAYLALISFLRK
jgi:hypothetical protein